MSWEEAVAAARSERTQALHAERLAEQREAEAVLSRQTELREIAGWTETILEAFDEAGWVGAHLDQPRFDDDIKFFRKWRAQAAIRITIPEVIVARGSLEHPTDVHGSIDFYRYPADGHRVFVVSKLPDSSDKHLQSGMVRFCGDPRGLLQREHILSAVARWAVERNLEREIGNALRARG